MSLPAIIKKSSLISNTTPTQKALVIVPAVVIGTWLLPWWITGGAVAFAGWQFWKKVR